MSSTAKIAATATAQPKYHIQTMGCQMNKADSEMLMGGLENLGLAPASDQSEASYLIINTCVVRQQAYDSAANMINKLKAVKTDDASKFIVVMGCMVGTVADELKKTFPHVDLWARPQQFSPIIETIASRTGGNAEGCLANLKPVTSSVTAYVSVVHGCDKFCTYCIIPYRRGREQSRPMADLVREITHMVHTGVKEVTLLGQNIDSYGQDLRPRADLSDLLAAINDIDGLERIRFLTSHPNDMSRKIVEAVRQLDKVCENINLPFQAGANRVLADMRRGYTKEQYLERVQMIKEILPGAALTSDVIVGFPTETYAEFEQSLDVLERVEFHKLHSYTYSTRPEAYASRRMVDDIPMAEKKRRLGVLNELQKSIQTKHNRSLQDTVHEVLIDAHKDGQASGRTRTDKLVHVPDPDGLLRVGRMVDVEVTATSPWSLQGRSLGVLTAAGAADMS